MKEALFIAESARDAGEIPVGSVVVKDGQIIGRGANRQLRDSDPAAHAEIIALREAGRKLGNWRLDGALMYSTVNPCAMCREAIRRARIEHVYYATPKARESTHSTEYTALEGYAGEASELIRGFFQKRR